ncbi:MAG: hypothetical protein ACTSXP_17945, partial [Promethearchaeota archaeon]
EWETDGGGDHPECVGSGLKKALETNWAEKAERVVVLVGDAPAHGYYEPKESDHWPDGNCCDNDPIKLMDEFVEEGITLFTVQAGECEYCEKLWKDLADHTQGSFHKTADASELLEELKAIIDRVASNIKDQIQVVSEVKKGGELTVEFIQQVLQCSRKVAETYYKKLVKKFTKDELKSLKKERAHVVPMVKDGICVHCNTALDVFNDKNCYKTDCGSLFHDGCFAFIIQRTKICPVCGAIMIPPEEVEEPIACGACGKKLELGTRFCPQCGKPVRPVLEPPTSESGYDGAKGLYEPPPDLIECPNCGYYCRKDWPACPRCHKGIAYK